MLVNLDISTQADNASVKENNTLFAKQTDAAHSVDIAASVKDFPVDPRNACHNFIIQPYTLDVEKPPAIKDVNDFDQDYDNFDGTAEVTEQFSRNYSITKSSDFTLTQGITVTANASFGAMGGSLGISVTATEDEVQHNSTSVTETHSSDFAVVIPAGEGRRVTEKQIQRTVENDFKAVVGAKGKFGMIPVAFGNNANLYYRSTDVLMAIPGKPGQNMVQEARIVRVDSGTKVQTKTEKLVKNPDDTISVKSVEELRVYRPSFGASDVQVDEAAFTSETPAFGPHTGTCNTTIAFVTTVPNQNRPMTPFISHVSLAGGTRTSGFLRTSTSPTT